MTVNFRDQEMVGGGKKKNFTDKYVVEIVQHPARTEFNPFIILL